MEKYRRGNMKIMNAAHGEATKRLEEIFISMQEMSEESLQSVPFSWFVSEDGLTVYAEVAGRNPIVMACFRNGIWEEGW